MKIIQQIALIGLILLCGCGRSPESKAKPQVSDKQPPIVVKGLQIGMTVKELSEVVLDKTWHALEN